MAKRSSKARTIFWSSVALLACVALPWLLPSGCAGGCLLDTTPIRPSKPTPADDADSGEERVS